MGERPPPARAVAIIRRIWHTRYQHPAASADILHHNRKVILPHNWGLLSLTSGRLTARFNRNEYIPYMDSLHNIEAGE